MPRATLGRDSGALTPTPPAAPPEGAEDVRAFASRIPAPAITTTTAAAARPRSSNGEDQSGLRNRRDLPRRRSGRSGLPGIPAGPEPAELDGRALTAGAGAADGPVPARAPDSRTIAIWIRRVSASGIAGSLVAASTPCRLVRAASIPAHREQSARCASILAAFAVVTAPSR